MAMMSDVPMPLAALRTQLASAVDIVVQTARLATGARKVTHITEVVEFSHDEARYLLRDLFARRFGAAPDGSPTDELVPTGALPASHGRIREHGLELPVTMLEAHRNTKEATHA
jgi:pilus assembly protein CpaF